MAKQTITRRQKDVARLVREKCAVQRDKLTARNRWDINIIGKPLTDGKKRMIERAVKKTVREYGEVLKKLGKGEIINDATL